MVVFLQVFSQNLMCGMQEAPMAGEKRKAAICIGVAQAGRLRYLSGAINGTRAFHAWASALGYDAKLIIDDPNPVTIPRLRQELEDLLRSATTAPIHRLI